MIAPLWVAALFFLVVLQSDDLPNHALAVMIMTVIGAVTGYAGSLLIGLPGFLLLRKHGITSWRGITFLGFAAGMVACFVFMVAVGISTGKVTPGEVVRAMLRYDIFWSVLSEVLAGGFVGAVVGFTVWLIARPDKDIESQRMGLEG
jgi:hypothetical protein